MSTSNLDDNPEKREILIFACSGSANVAEIADRVARGLSVEGVGSMRCVACLGADLPEDIQAAREADVNFLIEGCEKNCIHRIFEKHGIPNTRSIRVTDLGIVKLKGVQPTNTQVFLAYTQAKEALA